MSVAGTGKNKNAQNASHEAVISRDNKEEDEMPSGIRDTAPIKTMAEATVRYATISCLLFFRHRTRKTRKETAAPRTNRNVPEEPPCISWVTAWAHPRQQP